MEQQKHLTCVPRTDARSLKSAVSHVLQTILKITFSCLVGFPWIQIALSITALPCSTHQQFNQQNALWSVTGEVSTSDHAQNSSDHNDTSVKKKTQLSLRNKKRMAPYLVVFSLVPAQLVHKIQGHGGEQQVKFAMLAQETKFISQNVKLCYVIDIIHNSF